MDNLLQALNGLINSPLNPAKLLGEKYAQSVLDRADKMVGYNTPEPVRIPQPTPTLAPFQPQKALAYIKSKTPNGQSFEQAYPAATPDFLKQIGQAESLRPGLADLLLLQAFFESTLGRTTPNLFGVKPGGRSGASFDTPEAALDYQLSPSVMRGGANPNMNLLEEGEIGQPLTQDEITQFYSSYNPESAYLDELLSVLFGGE